MAGCWNRVKSPWTNRAKAEPSEAVGLNIANGRPFASPILGTHVPNWIEDTGCCRMGNELEECLKCRHIPENRFKLAMNHSSLPNEWRKCLHFNMSDREARYSISWHEPAGPVEWIMGTVATLFCKIFKATSLRESYGPACTIES